VNQGKVVLAGAPAGLRSELETGGRILVRVVGMGDSANDLETVRITLERMEIITHAEVRADALVVTPASPEVDPRPAIARTVIEHGWDLIELRALAADLEEIFLEVTRQERRLSEQAVTLEPSQPEVTTAEESDTEEAEA
jgi:ABC-2 type transport system ATP-binding protein